MNITHVFLSGPYNDGWSYHENVLAKWHRKSGHNVSLITTPFVHGADAGSQSYFKEGEYTDENGVNVVRLSPPMGAAAKILRKYNGLYEALCEQKPDIIFLHCIQTAAVKDITRYVRDNPGVTLYGDNHADYTNSAQSFVSKNVLHKIVWKHYTKLLLPYVKKLYGVLPARVDFLKKMYAVSPDKVELLFMGADDECVQRALRSEMKDEIRTKFNIAEDDFFVVTGGKIDEYKQEILLLADAVKNTDNDKVKLVIFGSIAKSLQAEFERRTNCERIFYAGWITPEDAYCYFAAADLVVFPGRHSVFWEQAVGVGAPCVFKRWDGTTHVDLGGNCVFLEEASEEELEKTLKDLCQNRGKLDAMRRVAKEKGIESFSYSFLAARAIGE
ncbi:MAG: glycosyltransferase family 4 protein [Clostridia bacterium]|nr:glycosyltransferase family 4 protein [Clostridia bacterium]